MNDKIHQDAYGVARDPMTMYFAGALLAAYEGSQASPKDWDKRWQDWIGSNPGADDTLLAFSAGYAHTKISDSTTTAAPAHTIPAWEEAWRQWDSGGSGHMGIYLAAHWAGVFHACREACDVSAFVVQLAVAAADADLADWRDTLVYGSDGDTEHGAFKAGFTMGAWRIRAARERP